MSHSSRFLAILATASLTACAVAPGPVEQQATQAGVACQQGYYGACRTAAALQPAASAERARAEQNAQVGTAVAAGLVGVAAGAIIADAARPHYYGRGYYRRW
ncbi:hypothetical protein [Muricoccus radiodurans]|uniref:hypothetical protein n=1 Tax=Muricoccus radiodurans TaxID=2231721 RepID=UPI003CE79A43